jgi:uroporphyrin-III C-methyltransferase/precorrin-2 dehydrogenase/sirohydrochlorin ferrochelatase
MRYFPLFADLQGRRVLVVGGGAIAERKVRLLLDAGAAVTVVAPGLTEWLAACAAEATVRGTATAGGTLTHVAEQFDAGHLQGMVLAIAATDDPVTNARVAAEGRERNVHVNVVDDAARSSFIVPAIVDRSPLVIAISTGGAAPVLARLVRERVEALLDGAEAFSED